MRQAIDEFGRIIIAVIIAITCMLTIGFAISYSKDNDDFSVKTINKATTNGVTDGGDLNDDHEVTVDERALPDLELTDNQKFDYDTIVDKFPFISRLAATRGKYKAFQGSNGARPLMNTLGYRKVRYNTGKKDASGKFIIKDAVDSSGNTIMALTAVDTSTCVMKNNHPDLDTGATVAVVRVYDEDMVEITKPTQELDLKNKKGTKSRFFQAVNDDFTRFRFLPVDRDREYVSQYTKAPGDEKTVTTKSYTTRVTVRMTLNDHTVQKTTRIIVD